MKKTSLFALSLISLAVLSACGSESTSPTDTDSSSETMRFDMPRSISAGDSSLDSAETMSLSSATQVSESLISETAVILDTSVEGSDNSLPVDMLIADSSLLQARVDIARYELDSFDSIWDDVIEHCASVADGVECNLPLSLLENLGEPEANVDDIVPLDVDIAVEVGDTTDPDAVTGNVNYLESASYTRNPTDEHEHAIGLKNNYGEGESSTSLYKWDEAYTNIRTTAAGTWPNGTFKTELVYTASDAGDKVSLLEKGTQGSDQYTSAYQLKELNDGNNGVEVTSQATWENEIETGKVVSSALADNSGGALTSTSTIQKDGTTYITHYKSTFDENGTPSTGEYCVESDGVDCDEPGNWQVHSNGISLEVEPGEISTELPSFEDIGDIELELYQDFIDSDLLQELLDDCERNGISAENCFVIE